MTDSPCTLHPGADRGSPEYLEELAQRADPDNLWQRNPFDQLALPSEQRKQLDTAVALRRYAGVILDMERAAKEGKSLVLTRLGPSVTARDFVPMKKRHLESVARRRVIDATQEVPHG